MNKPSLETFLSIDIGPAMIGSPFGSFLRRHLLTTGCRSAGETSAPLLQPETLSIIDQELEQDILGHKHHIIA